MNEFDFEWAAKYCEARATTLYRLLPTMALAGFVAGVALTMVLGRMWPNAGRYMLVVAAVASFANAVVSCMYAVRARATYKQSLEALRAVDPEFAKMIEEKVR